jgi:hypothetical protein
MMLPGQVVLGAPTGEEKRDMVARFSRMIPKGAPPPPPQQRRVALPMKTL